MKWPGIPVARMTTRCGLCRVFSAALETRDTSNLLRLARATTTAKDDLLVEEIERLRGQASALDDELRQHREAQDERLRRIRELQDVRRDFKVNRFDDVHSRFKKGDALTEMIGGVINGVIQGYALWQALQRNQRYRDVAGEWPDFGSGGIRRPKSRRRRNKTNACAELTLALARAEPLKGAGWRVQSCRERPASRAAGVAAVFVREEASEESLDVRLASVCCLLRFLYDNVTRYPLCLRMFSTRLSSNIRY